MIETGHTLVIGTSADPITMRLTQSALDMLNDLPSMSRSHPITDHRALLTTIAISRVAAGTVLGATIDVDADDILDVLLTAGPKTI